MNTLAFLAGLFFVVCSVILLASLLAYPDNNYWRQTKAMGIAVSAGILGGGFTLTLMSFVAMLFVQKG